MKPTSDRPDTASIIDEGYRWLAAGHATAAVRAFRAAMEHGAAAPLVLDGLTSALMASEQFSEAAGMYELAINIGHKPDIAVRHLGTALIQDGRSQEAVEKIQSWLAAHETDYHSRLVLGTAQAAMGDFEAAERNFRACTGQTAICGNAWQQLTRIRTYDSEDDPDIQTMKQLCSNKAITEFQLEKIFYGLAKALDDCKNFDSAFATAQRANSIKQARIVGFDRAEHLKLIDRIATFDWAGWHPDISPQELPVQPVFIIGLPRSGTTLVDNILQSHPGVGGAGELAYIQNRVIELFWPFPDNLDNNQLLSQLAARYPTVLGQHAPNRTQVTDKFPGHFLYLGLMARLWPDAKLISVSRDPTDTGLSMYFQDFPDNQGQMCDLADIGFHILCYKRLMDIWHGHLGHRLLDIRYETLVAEPDATVELLLAHCDIRPDAAAQDHRAAGDTRTMSVWQARQPINTRSVDRSRSYTAHLQPLKLALDQKV